MYRSRIPQITAELAAKLDAAVSAGAEVVEARAKERVPVNTGKLRDAIRVEHTSPGEAEVVAGNTEVFYGHIVEHGSVHTPAHPFMVPAAEEARAEVTAIVAAALKSI